MRRFALALLACALALPVPAALNLNQTNLVTNNPAAHPAAIPDASLVNPWGVSFSPTSPFWVSDNGAHVSTLYQVDPATQAPTKIMTTVTFQGDGSVTGQVSNASATAFNGDNFLFVSEDGTISGWRASLGSNTERFQVASTDNVYKGAAIATITGNTYLYAANFKSGAIDVLKGTSGIPNLTGSFTDPNLPAFYAPFNIQNLGGKLYVAYAHTNAPGIDQLSGPGLGIVDAFDTNGNLLARVASQGSVLNAPWGLAIAPPSFAEFAGDLLVGNFGDGRINAYNLTNNTFAGQLNGSNGLPLTINGLWALTPGNDSSAGTSNAIYFTAGPDNESNGLFGVLTVPEPGCVLILAAPLLLCRRPRRR